MTDPRAVVIRVRGVVQGVGFRPFVYRLAKRNTLAGWVLNGGEGVEMFLEGPDASLQAFVRDLVAAPPTAAEISTLDVTEATPSGLTGFSIRESQPSASPTVRVSPDLPVCDACLTELFDPQDRRYLYPYINCTNCGPRYSVVEALPYDRVNTTMRAWQLDAACAAEYSDPSDRRFHAEPIACPACGPTYRLERADGSVDAADGRAAIAAAAALLREGAVVAVKGIGGYHLACDAANVAAVEALRTRKFRKEKPFALMVRDLDRARLAAHLSPAAEALLTSAARPIVLAPSRVSWSAVAPGTDELGLMLPYAPLHYLLFAAGAPDVLVMTSANRSSEPIAYQDDAARASLTEIADALLIGQRPIARRVEDSVARGGACGPVILRRSRGYAPGVVTELPTTRPILAVGADLKNTVTLVVGGRAIVSQHIGDLDHHGAREAFAATIDDLIAMYGVQWEDVHIVHDAHPAYVSTLAALERPAVRRTAVQHHRAHVASVLAERRAWDRRVVGVSFDGTGYGDDGTIWGGEFFVGSVETGFDRLAHLRPAGLVGGDAAARWPTVAAAGFLNEIGDLPDLTAEPFRFGPEYQPAARAASKGVRTFTTTSMGRLFDAVAALLGFTRRVTYEGQAAIWVEHLARQAGTQVPYPFRFDGRVLDYRPLLAEVARDRRSGRNITDIARAFQGAVAAAAARVAAGLCREHETDVVVCSGGVFQNDLLLTDLKGLLEAEPLTLWTNQAVPPNDGGVSLGQAALGAFATTSVRSESQHA